MSRTVEQIDADLLTCQIGRQDARNALAQRGRLTEAECIGEKTRVQVLSSRIDRLLEERFLATLERLVAS